MRRILLNTLLGVAGLCVAAGLGELLVRLWGAAPEVVYVEKWRMRLACNPRIGFEPIPHLDAAGQSVQFYGYRGASNSMGFRDSEHPVAKPSGSKRILVLGDSIAAGLWIERDEDVLPAMLERELVARGRAVDVMNFGVLGYNTQQEVEILREKGLRYRPDLVVLAYCLNDRQRDDGHIYGHLLAAERNETRLNAARVPTWVARSALFRLLSYRAFASLRSPPEGGDRADPERFARDTVDESFGVLAELARRHRFEVLVIVFPDFTGIEAMSPDYAFQPLHDAVAALSERSGFFRLDLLAAFRRCKQERPGELVAFDRYHPRPRGSACAAKTIAEFVLAEVWSAE